jgi:hypothetical protein
MKTTIKTITAATLMAVLGLVSFAKAQSATDVTVGEEVKAFPTSSSTVAPKVIKSQSVSESFLKEVESLKQNATKAISAMSLKDLSTGGAIERSVKPSNGSKLLDEHNVSVKVTYDARPVGGVLSVRVAMSPSFRGIGVSTRATISRSTAMAVDEFDETLIQGIVNELSQEIQDEYLTQVPALSSVK